MIGLSHVLPPLATDYSGAASLLYEHGIMAVMCDAGCCTHNYLCADEPRWSLEQKAVYCIALRTLDVTLGNEGLLVDRIVRTVRESKIETPAIALVGTPIPAITGMDMGGMACEVESATGIPTVGLTTSGFKTYEAGIVGAFKTLLTRFGGCRIDGSPHFQTFILGASIFDYGTTGLLADALRSLEDARMYPDPLAHPAANTGLSILAELASSRLNVAASSVGIEMARFLERLYGTPYRVGIEIDIAKLDIPEGKRVLIVHDQVVGNSLRASIEKSDCESEVRVVSLGGWHSELARAGDSKSQDESDLKAVLRDYMPDVVLGDPLLRGLIRAAHLTKTALVPLAFPALSGRLCW